MKDVRIWKQELADGVHAARLASLYCCAPEDTAPQAARYAAALDGLEAAFGPHSTGRSDVLPMMILTIGVIS